MNESFSLDHLSWVLTVTPNPAGESLIDPARRLEGEPSYEDEKHLQLPESLVQIHYDESRFGGEHVK
jgi:hypothetical protein